MPNSLKRSISPQSKEKLSNKKRQGFAFSNLLSLINPFSSRSPEVGEQHIPETRFSLEEDIKAEYNFSSAKKRNLSTSSRPRSGITPRFSTLSSNIGSYQTFSDSFRFQKEELNNDLERRVSHVYDDAIAKDGTIDDDELDEKSLFADLRQNGIHVNATPPMLDQDREDSLPLIIEHEFAPLYTDDEGNLIRPPFINLDPRERYHLLQLKRSITASEALKERIKYMVDPNETVSHIDSATNKVETATQTRDENFLEESLIFPSFKRKSQMPINSRSLKRAKNNHGFFVGEFFYDSNEALKGPASNKLEGYLGSIAKPAHVKKDINGKSSAKGNESHDLSLDSEYVKKAESISNIIKLKTGGESKKVENKKETIKPSSGFQFSLDNDKISSVINKRAEEEASLESETKAPKFDIPLLVKRKSDSSSTGDGFLKGKVNSQNHNAEDGGLEVGSQNNAWKENGPAKNTFLFGSTKEEDKNISKPKFEFNPVKESDRPDTDIRVPQIPSNKTQAPVFNFGNKKEEQVKPKFSFGATEKPDAPKLDLEISKEGTEKTIDLDITHKKGKQEKPSFSFGATNKNADSTKLPAFSFGKQQVNDKGSDHPTKTLTAPTFTSGAPANTKKEAKIILDTSENTDNPVKPSFVFGAPKDGSAPKSVSFGSSEKEAGSFPSFNFGAKPAGNSLDNKNATSGAFQGAVLSLSAEGSFPKLSTATPEPFANTSNNGNAQTAATPFSFGQGPSTAPQSSFVFGNNQNTNAPGFNFAPRATAAPSFSFNPSSKPAFNFTGSKEGTPDPASVFGAATAATPGAVPAATTPFAFNAGNARFPSNGPGIMANGAGSNAGTTTPDVFNAAPPSSTPTPPLMSGRRIAQMRQRRR
ncbi:uncharacterized protein PRCAT00003384001 [Priceomyces carsonii]|uniref:uncharacterized protein n=1 Tax=Priceomyces carsonii TaxID=28549 RepID=UPI002ED8E964|nr:unnamed protein product [Priceomyces carsonii]